MTAAKGLKNLKSLKGLKSLNLCGTGGADPFLTGPSPLSAATPRPEGTRHPAPGPARQELGTLEAEIRRLECLGGRRVRYVENDPDESHWIMADPEGNEFCCSRPPWEPRPPRPAA